MLNMFKKLEKHLKHGKGSYHMKPDKTKLSAGKADFSAGKANFKVSGSGGTKLSAATCGIKAFKVPRY